MKIAVYTIALNEVKFVKRWAESAKDADYRLIADTGSTDGTPEIAKDSLGVNVVRISISPWRFDLARNAALAGSRHHDPERLRSSAAHIRHG